MATYDDIGVLAVLRDDLQDEMKSNGVDLLLPFSDFSSGWILVSQGNIVTISHNFGSYPRLVTIYSNIVANFNSSCGYEIGANSRTSFSVESMSDTTISIKNDSKNTSYKYVYIRLWR